MAFLSGFDISASGMTAQRMRLDIASENIANIQTTRTQDGTPYRRKIITFQENSASFQSVLENKMNTGNGVIVSGIEEDQTDLPAIYDPEHPDADEQGYVYMPNVDLVKEVADAMAATRSYEANITAFNAMKLMVQKAIDIGK